MRGWPVETDLLAVSRHGALPARERWHTLSLPGPRVHLAPAWATRPLLPGTGSTPMPPLREIRADQVLTIRELAQRAGVAPSSIFSIEARRTTPRMATMRRLATALGVAPEAVDEFRQAIEAAKELSPRRG